MNFDIYKHDKAYYLVKVLPYKWVVYLESDNSIYINRIKDRSLDLSLQVKTLRDILHCNLPIVSYLKSDKTKTKLN